MKALKYRFAQPDSADPRMLTAELSRRLQALTGDDGRSSFAGDAFDPARDAFLVVSDGDTPVACGAIVDVDARVCEVKRMYAQVSGLGIRVLRQLEVRAQEMGYARLRLSTRRVNTRAVRFYQKHGLREIASYGKMGYHLAGEIPGYARSASGELHTTSFFYKPLAPGGPPSRSPAA